MPKEIVVKSILNKKKVRDPWFLDNYTLNPYSGCSFNCLYCFIRGSKYGVNMEKQLSVKINAPEILEKELSRRAKKGQYGIITLSSATDPYLQIEKEYQMTRRLLEVILEYRFPVHIITKSDLVSRDFDLLEQINLRAILPDNIQHKLNHKVIISFSFSTVDNTIGRIFEPGATLPEKRLLAVKKSLDQGFYTGITLMPLLPYISDTGEHLMEMFNTFSKMGVKYIFPATLTLFGASQSDSKTLVLKAVQKFYPQLLEKYERFFAESQEMPKYYKDAFYLKTKELSLQFGIRNTIIDTSS